jgi:hypothetical protein
MRFAERIVLSRDAFARRRGEAKASHSARSAFGQSYSGVKSVLALQRTHGNAFVQRLVQRKLIVEGANVFPAGRYRWNATAGGRLVTDKLIRIIRQGNDSGYTAIRRREPDKKQTPLQKLDEDLESSWTLDSTIQADLRALSGSETQVVLSGTAYRDKLIERLSVDGIREALLTLGANFATTRSWLVAAGVALFNITYGPDYARSTPDGTLDAELERRMLEMCQFLILNQIVTADISLNWAARSRPVAHVKSTAYHIIENYVALDDLKKLLKEAANDKDKNTHTAEAGDSLSLIAGYPNDGWRERLDQLIAANSQLPSIRDRSPDDPRYGWLEIGDVVNIPWAKPDGGNGKAPEREVRDLDGNLWYVENWTKAETDEQARKNRGVGKGEKLSLAYEGYEVTDPKRLPNSLDPTHPPVSSHVFGLAIDVGITWGRSTKLPSYAPGWSQSEIFEQFKLHRPIMENNPYGPAAAEPWHFEKAP